MRLTARPVVFGAPLLVALALGMALWAWGLAASGGTTSPVSATWNVEYWQRSAAGELLDHKILSNAVQNAGLEVAMERVINAGATIVDPAGTTMAESNTFDQIVLMNLDDAAAGGILAANILLLVDGSNVCGGVDNNPADGAFSDGGGDGVGDGTVAVTFCARGDAAAATQMHLVKAAVDDTVVSGAAAIVVGDVLATIEISVDLADTDTLTVNWTLDVS